MKTKAEEKPAYDWRETGRVIGFYRRSLHLSQDEIAERIGSGCNSTVSFWERGIKEPKISNLVAVAEALGVSETDLLHPSEEVKKWANMYLQESQNTETP